MNLFSAKPLLAAAVACAGLASMSAAHARSDVYFSLGINSPMPYYEPAPVYVQPQPVYVQPQPVYVQPQPIYVQPAPTYYSNRGAWGDRDHDGIPNAYDRRDNRRDHRGAGPWGDRDRDGVPNRYDRAPSNPYRR
jgi:hypothetical protein